MSCVEIASVNLSAVSEWIVQNWLEEVAFVSSAVGVWLTTRRSLICWPVILVSCILYGEVFREARLLSDMLLQVVFAACAVYGWWHWVRGVQTEGAVTVEALSWRGWVWGLAAGAAGSVILGFVMARYFHASLPWLDSALTSFSLVGQWWQARKYLANWWLWIAVDLIYIGEYVYKHLNLTAGLYALFVALAVLGLRDWRRALERQEAEAMAGVLERECRS
jgi:nicotinamide mononucleotide transporter